MPSLTVEDYHIGWICALPKEMTAALSMLDEEHPILEGQEQQDNNNYALGRIHKHNVVIACMPAGADGLVNAANVARDMVRTFPALRVCLMVGIGGGIPNLAKSIDIRLGDIVVSQPDGIWGGVVQYDKGKAESGGKFVLKGQLNQPPPVLLQTLARLKAEHDRRDSWVPRYMKEAIEQNSRMKKTGYVLPTVPDRLYCRECEQDIENLATDCVASHHVREQRSDSSPAVHYGIVASGNRVVKDAEVRDDLREQFGALCVEMEAAGLMNHFPCLVIRGICDYADSHKNDKWHPYAAMTAAAYAKEFLYYASPTQASQEKPMQQVIGLLDGLSQTSVSQLVVSQEHLRVIKGQIYQSKTQYESDKHAQCHQAFKTSSYEEFKDINPPRVAGTCQWVLNHLKYREWYESSRDGLLWISADPGCGKSVLAKSLIENELQSTDSHTVCYFFFKDNQQQDSVATALCAILHQLFSHHPQLIQHAIPAWDKDGSKLSGEISELWRIWLAAARDSEANDVICVLDALDECNETERRKIISLLTDFYGKTLPSPSKSRQGRLKILVTSRPYDEIRRGFNAIPSNLPTIQLRGEDENVKISKEIDLVIHAQVVKLAADLKLDSDTTDQLRKKLLEMEHRTYLWLHLATDDIYHTFRKSLRRNQQLINFIPATVEQAYEKILGRVGKAEELTVKQILQIVIGARRPLAVTEMALALGIATSTDSDLLETVKIDHEGLGDRIRDLCGLFIFINHSKIYLIHQTAKEFLVRKGVPDTPVSGWKHCLDPIRVEKEMVRICVEFLCFDDIQSTVRSLVDRLENPGKIDEVLDETNEVESFILYSAEYWHRHLRSSNMLTDDSLFSKPLQLYDATSDLHSQWFSIYWRIFDPWSKISQMNNLQLAAFLGHEQILKLIMDQERHPDVNLADSNGKTPLMWASQLGYPEIVKLLLDKGVEVNAPAGHYGNALQVASLQGQLEVVQLLIDEGAEVNAQGGDYSNALQAASFTGQLEVVQLLLDEGAEVNAQGGHYSNALQAASYTGQLEVVQLLLDEGAEVNAQGGHYSNALQAASYTGQLEVVQLLLDEGAEVNAQGGHYGNALQAASYQGQLEVVQLLLDEGAEVNAQGGDYSNALQAASFTGQLEVVQLLLDEGAEVSAQGGRYGNALQAASYRGQLEVVQLLLDEGAEVNAQGGDYSNALQAASFTGQLEVVQLLLDEGAEVNAQGGDYGNALQAASCGDQLEVVQLLLDEGAEVNAQGGYYSNALQAASYEGQLEVMQLLLDEGAEVNVQGGHYGNALQAASCGDQLEVVQLLLDEGAEVNAQGGYYGNALQAASCGDQLEVVQLLLDEGAEVNAQGGYYGNALQAASYEGQLEVAKLLQSAGRTLRQRTAGGVITRPARGGEAATKRRRIQ